MVSYNVADLEFILAQIEIAEAHSAGTPLTELISNPLLPAGLRTVDGTLNNLIPGRENWGSADQPFPRLTEPNYITGTPDPTFDVDGPFGPAPAGSIGADYNSTSSVVDSAPRTISNLIVDQTLGNPAAIMAALEYAGITGSAATAVRNLIVSQYEALAPLAEAASDAAAAEVAAQSALNGALANLALAQAANAAAQLTVTAYNNAIALAPAAATAATQAQLQVGTFALGLGFADEGGDGLVDASDLAALSTAITFSQAAATAAGAVLAALQAGTNNVTADDLNDAQARVDEANLLLSNLQALESDLAADPAVTPTDIGAAVAASTLAGNNAAAAGAVAADLSDADSLGAAVTAAAPAAAALATAQGIVGTRQDEYDDAVIASNTADTNLADASVDLNDTLADNSLELTANGSLVIPNVAPDEGISAPFNSWMTLFGQFFDHGLDLVEKTSTSKVYIPLQPDDPLYVEGGSQNFMVITRTTPDALNVTTPFVDQNQTYTSHASHQVFLREYAKIADGSDTNTNLDVVATGHLKEGSNGGLATWADIKAQASEMLGIALEDRHIHEVPLLATDLYGAFERAPNGYAMVMVSVALSNGDVVDAKASGKDGGLDLFNIAEADLVGFTVPLGETITGISTQGTGHAFLDDIAHTAAPAFVDPDRNPGTQNSVWTTADGDSSVGNGFNDQVVNGLGVRLTYDDELLDRHFITGDGRGNENIGLTTVHHVFHSEHNRMAEHTKDVAISSGDAAFVNKWLLLSNQITQGDLDGINNLSGQAKADAIDALGWNGERLFQAARFGTEMQYQHLVFEEFARKVNPMVDLFVFNPTLDINPAIFAEFAHVVYRFGHSMLTETVDRLGADGQTTDDIGLIQAFLNPIEFDKNGTISADEAAGAIIRGMTRQQGNEIDEFVTEALRNNLLGLPLDLATVNLARGRETGMPTLQQAREEFYEATRSEWLKPYTSWADFAQHMKNPASIINFIAAYGKHESILAAGTLEEKRDAATLLVLGGPGAPSDRLAFLNSTSGVDDNGTPGDATDDTDVTWSAANTGLNDVDLWVGGLAEAILPFGGMLGSTFTFVFEMQMENLQNGDRLYYLSRTQGTHFLQELENNAFSKIIMLNTDLGADDATHLPGEVFSTPQHILEVDLAVQNTADPDHEDEVLQALEPKVARDQHLTIDGNTYDHSLKFTGGEHVVLGGSEQGDVLIGDLGDDTIWGDGGDDYIEGGHGINRLHGGDGDDIIYGGGDPEFIHGDAGNDVIQGGNGLGDLIFAGSGSDFVIGGIDGKEVFGAEGNDFILGSPDVDFLLGGEGDDWIEGGEGFDTIAGENSELFFNSVLIGHDVMFAGTNEQDFDAESGDDIMVQGESVMRNEGMLGFDWVTYKGVSFGADADLGVPIFTNVAADILRNRFDRVEAVSGWDHDDTIIGDNRVSPDGPFNGNLPVSEQSLEGDGLDRAGVERIEGLRDVLGLTQAQLNAFAQSDIVFDDGNVLLGGGGSDVIQGNAGDDIIDGDKWLNVRIGINDANGNQIGTADKMQGAVHFYTASEATELGAGYAAANPALLALSGRPLDELMFNRTLNPNDLAIVREIVDGGATGDVDIARFSDIQANYEITLNGDTWTVRHRLLDRDGVEIVGENGADGIDTVRNVEALQFSDSLLIIDPGIVNAPVDGSLEIIDGGAAGITLGEELTVAIGTVNDPDGTPDISTFNITWQVELTLGAGDWSTLEDPVTEAPITGLSFTPTAAFELEGLRLRVVASFTDGHGIPEFVTSAPTDPVAPEFAAVATNGDDLLAGTVNADFIDALAGNDIVNALGGNDTIIGGPGNDILNGGADTGANLGDVAVFLGSATGATPDFVFSLNAEGVLEVVSTGVAEEDAINTIENLLFIENGGALTDLELAALVNQIRDAPPVDGVPTAFGGQTVTLRSVAGILDGEVITGTANADTLLGGDWGDTITGAGGDDAIAGGIGNDIIVGDGAPGVAGDDTISWRVGEGRDVIDGGGNATVAGDVFDVRGSGNGDTFTIYSLAEAVIAGLGPFTGSTEIVLTRQAVGGPVEVVAELDNVESLVINNTAITPGVTAAGGDTVAVVGDLTGTSLNPNLPPTGMDIAALDGTDDLRVQENVAGAIIGNAVVHDETVNDTHTFEITRLENGVEVAEDRFEIVDGDLATAGQQLVFKLKAGVSINFEEDQRIELVVRTFDSAGNGSTNNPYDYTIRALDVRESVAGTTGDIGDDDIHGSSGKDHIVGGKGADRAWGSGGDDRFVTRTGDGNDWYSGGSGSDTYDASAAAGDNAINLLTGSATGTGIGTDKLYGIEHAWGGSGNNTMTGNSSNNSLRGGAGSDTINGGSGNDSLNGNSGNDSLNGGSGHDTLNGGTGSDSLRGGDGNDTLDGRAGNDNLNGGAGDDTIKGGAGNDRLNGGTGNDRMTGGAGNDKFVFNSGFGNDVINDFDAEASGGQDKIDISALGITDANFAMHVHILDVGADTTISIDGESIVLKGVSNSSNVTISDFVLFGG